MRVRSKIYHLQLKHRFGISRASLDYKRTLIVELEQDGIKGYGEATENSYYGFTVEAMLDKLNVVTPFIESYVLDEPEIFWDELHQLLPINRFLHCAIDMAAHDLYGKIMGKSLWKLWGLKLENLPLTNFTIAIDGLEKMKEKLLEQPWPLYKIKLGTSKDIEIVKTLRELTDSPFRIDANTAWTAEECINNSPILKNLGVEFIEQPLPHDSWDEMKRVKKMSALPIIADEACRTMEDIPKCIDTFHGINVKLVKAGGITPARRMLVEGRRLGLKTMLGCMTESSVGISAVGQLLPYLDYVDMDGALLLENDIAEGPKITRGKIQLPDRPGTGALLLENF